MNSNAQKWIDALLSNQYKQICKILSHENGSYCSIGLGCEIYRQETNKGEWILTGTIRAFKINDKISAINFPKPVREWLGLKREYAAANLISLNDVQKNSFNEIAKYIQKYPKDFFEDNL